MATRVYIGRLSYRASERDIEHFFRGYGRIRDIVLKNGFGFVEFDEPRDADDAVYDLNGKELAGERVMLEFSKRGPRAGGGRGFDRYPPQRRDARQTLGVVHFMEYIKCHDEAGCFDNLHFRSMHSAVCSCSRMIQVSGVARSDMFGSTLCLSLQLNFRLGDQRKRNFGGRQGPEYGPPTQTRHRMIVENLSTRISWQEVPRDVCTFGVGRRGCSMYDGLVDGEQATEHADGEINHGYTGLVVRGRN
ncbi:hypothetical protein DICVIV_04245 [Dictyocaulus viviparus]|uniref:RRM domain-containing protein n=1 Tax=Dictyocaulus viviparus TaxID=29172 RepID=A0A0D8XYS3_DICVI|nr:hypothetical protein DICVIV_04245 [Dictyocaulus viviparus]